jgi:alcohol dehydrogenase
MTQLEHIGYDSIKSLQSILEGLAAKKVFLVMEEVSYWASGARDHIESLSSSYNIKTHSGFSVNPNIEDLEAGIQVFNHADADVVIALGGGSVIDMAKMINFFGCNKCDPRAYLAGKKKCAGENKPLIAVPTTSGTGSEATHFAVLYVDHVKHSIADSKILPDVAIIDPGLTMSMPAGLTAITGMDALSQAIESYWCVNSNDESKAYAREAIALTMGNLATAVNNPTEVARLSMSKAAHLAGKAINITKTTAPHAISYPLTSFFSIPHGHAVALTLPAMLEYNASVTGRSVLDCRGHTYVLDTVKEIAGMLGQKDVAGGKRALEALMDSIGLERRLSALGLQSGEDIQKIVTMGFNPDRVKNNPRQLTEESLRELLISIY